MTAAGQVRSEIVSRLKAAGLDAAEAYEDERFRERSGSVVAVGAKQAELAHAGLMNYLGERYDAESGRTVEVYGRKLKMAASLDVYAPRRKGARGCEQHGLLRGDGGRGERGADGFYFERCDAVGGQHGGT